MATIAAAPPSSPPLTWLAQHLREELSPYPGRAALVARMTATATLVLILSMTFRLPYAAFGAIYTLIIPRETPHGMLVELRTIIFAFAASALYALVSAKLFLDEPSLRLLWVMSTLFLMFYLLSAMANYGAASRFGYLLVIILPLWDLDMRADLKIENMLWAFGTLSLASVITAAIELAYAELRPGNRLLQPIVHRLASIEAVLSRVAAGELLDRPTQDDITRYALTGTSRVRAMLFNSSYSPQYREQMGAVVALVGRLTDLAANAVQLSSTVADSEQPNIAGLAANVGRIRSALVSGNAPNLVEPAGDTSAASGLPLLHEMQRTVSLTAEALMGFHASSTSEPDPGTHRTRAGSRSQPSNGEARVGFFVADAFSNPHHVRFGLRGCLAATLCYILYNASAWPGISTAVTTCYLTAQTTVGSSRQKQLLRIAGAVIGVLMGVGAEVFVLPHLDSIGGFTVLFVLCTAVSAWVITSSARLSYCGVQMAVAFYLINLSDFAVRTSLVPARDRIVGILLGLAVMWTVFDQLWGVPAVVQMRRAFVATLRGLAQLAREPLVTDVQVAAERTYALRQTIDTSFNDVRSLGDGVLFEFGPTRETDLVWRRLFLAWHPQLRLAFLTRVALLKYRLGVPGFELPPHIAQAQAAFDRELGRRFDAIADRLEGKTADTGDGLHQALAHLEQVTRAYGLDVAHGTAPRPNALLPLSHRIETLTSSLDNQIGSTSP